MRSKHINVGPDSAREKVVLEVLVDDTNAVSAEFSASEVEDLMEKIAFARAALKEGVVPDLDPMAKMRFTVIDPAWRSSTDFSAPDTNAKGVLLALRHTGYGWLSFLLPHKEAKALGQWLIESVKDN
jgi:hypothetical protein